MRLKRLEVQGFKSFADRTVFDFEADLTGIVGPNGCGKSNVVDALKWVLGDRSAKSLRGSEMLDVIFKGAEGRDALPAAEVSIVLENDVPGDDDESSLPADSPLRHLSEVRIGRRLTRDKESSYLINGETVRLKDVRDLLMNTGLGVGAYSVMEQGRIDAVLSADPESRRAIFEEAAGISKFKLQKRETLRKLERTEQNLSRSRDLLEERTRRIRSLKIQAGKARRWQELQARLRDLRSAVAVLEGRRLRDDESGRRARITEIDARLAEADRIVGGAREQLEGLDARIRDAESRLDEVQERLRDASSQRDAARQRASGLQERIEELREDAESSVGRVGGLEEQRRERVGSLDDARRELEAAEGELVRLGKESEERAQEVREQQQIARVLQADRERARDRLLELVRERSRLRNRAHDERATLRGLDASLARLAQRRVALDDELGSRRRERAAAEAALADLRARDGWLAREEATTLQALERADGEAAELARLEGGLRERLASMRSRLETLQSMEADGEGVDQGPRFLLAENPPGLRGRLIDMIDVDLEYSKALEAALGDFVQALVVDTRAAARAMLGQLAAAGRGRASLLVAEDFGDRLEHGSLFALPDGADFLYRKVRCRREAWPMVQWLLRGVCYVDELDLARPERTDLCFVTRDGALVCGPRLDGGGESVGGLVVRRAWIHSLAQDAERLDAEVAAMQADRESATSRVASLDARLRRLRGAREALRERVAKAETDRSRLSDRIEHVVGERDGVVGEHADLRRQRARAHVRLGEELCGELVVRRLEVHAHADEQRVAAELEAGRKAVEAASRRAHDIQLEQSDARSRCESQNHRIEALDGAIADLDAALEELQQRREQALAGVERATAELRQAVEAVERSSATCEGLEEERAGRADELQEARDAWQTHQLTVREHETARDTLREEVGRLRVEAADVGHRFGRLEERLREDTGVELRRLLGEIEGLGLCGSVVGPPPPTGPDGAPAIEALEGPPLPPAMLAPELELTRLWTDADFDPEACRKEVQVLQSQRDRLGAVNLEAVAELEAEESRIGTLEQDLADLTESRKTLMEALRRMELESRALFEKTFEQARENFRSIFRKLFQGGRADMYLTEDENALDSGIEIVAKPPGKELQSIGLLSGGERSLTALAILFAVFKVKPSPFCILDEVDAALDESNVERFLRVLRDFVGPSQFCIVTHHKRTMAACDVLYGITMMKRGVSTRISVALDEVDEFTEGPSFKKAEKERIAGEEHVGF